MQVAGATREPEIEAIRREMAEAQMAEAIEALADALVSAPHWRTKVQALLRKLAAAQQMQQ